ncbi:UDP-3-O-[3-hydroxymyristoyl] glucosamine N-acyltransferase [Chryseobacterium sp. RU37D]|uniref:UDP-3-O-(3-hydroxymyristoyl)glucosamine N-acyltransferase n=1 Tax=Chryseobacterium sp. RU37D TaxID=1907397 RepID=UPI000954B2EB|nr:UDP-3-O-(3-hydroxymyristoyl)glucosamine N-acyltransferase [Chryseobacterium sp. RU37D]SIQ22894.1 UDP-3-O-[3-hydroxymyristoyl] glucosamine N-acyltransferase [Chryseobacterium sp. RU37D]
MIALSEIIERLNPEKVIGNIDREIINAIQLDLNNDRDDVLMWVSAKFSEKLKEVKKGVVICSSSLSDDFINPDCTYLIFENPRLAFQKALSEFFMPKKKIGISKTAIIGENVSIGKNVYIGEYTVIEDNCTIGDHTVIDHHTTIKKDTIIGENVIIGANNTIGGVGFGYEKDETGQFVFIPHIGNVIIGNNVEVGNNTCIDRAVLGSTVLMENVKVDNLVHIAHGVKIGKNSLVIANAMVAGSVEIGENTWVAPSSSILNQKKVGSDVTIGLSAVVVKDVENGQTVIGSPAEEISVALNKKKIMNEKLFK